MKIIKPKQSRFDEDLARRVNREKTHAPDNTSQTDYLVDFCDTQIYRTELDALAEVYAQIGKKPEEYYDPTVNSKIRTFNGHINILDLSDLNLQNLPESVGNWKNLNIIKIGNNQLSTLPESVGNWKGINFVSIKYNKLASLPESVGNWEYLWDLHLMNNQLSTLPESTRNWKNLSYLNIDFNTLDSVTESIVNCINLREICLYGNNIAQNEAYLDELKKRFPNTIINIK